MQCASADASLLAPRSPAFSRRWAGRVPSKLTGGCPFSPTTLRSSLKASISSHRTNIANTRLHRPSCPQMGRPGAGKAGRQVSIATNHFAVQFQGIDAFHYDVKIAPQSGGSDRPPREAGAGGGGGRGGALHDLYSALQCHWIRIVSLRREDRPAERRQRPPAARGRRCGRTAAAAVRRPDIDCFACNPGCLRCRFDVRSRRAVAGTARAARAAPAPAAAVRWCACGSCALATLKRY